jgi:hypothetical protein
MMADYSGRLQDGAVAQILDAVNVPHRQGIVAVKVRLLRGTFKIGEVTLESSEGRTSQIALLGVEHISFDLESLNSINQSVLWVDVQGLSADSVRSFSWLLQASSSHLN